jgi:hypothetical protein
LSAITNVQFPAISSFADFCCAWDAMLPFKTIAAAVMPHKILRPRMMILLGSRFVHIFRQWVPFDHWT